jgi:myo-inositol-1(or 4)-monophosphatase
VLDPIDGTRAFILGMPLWGTLIGLEHGAVDGATPVLGVMNQPFTGERFWSDGRAAAWRRGEGPAVPLATRDCARLADAALTTTHPGLFVDPADRAGFAALEHAARLTRYGGDCYAYCLLAAGFIDLIVEAGLKPYDVVALIPIIESAGGIVTTWDGRPANAGGRILAAGDARVHAEALAVLRQATAVSTPR